MSGLQTRARNRCNEDAPLRLHRTGSTACRWHDRGNTGNGTRHGYQGMAIGLAMVSLMRSLPANSSRGCVRPRSRSAFVVAAFVMSDPISLGRLASSRIRSSHTELNHKAIRNSGTSNRTNPSCLNRYWLFIFGACREWDTPVNQVTCQPCAVHRRASPSLQIGVRLMQSRRSADPIGSPVRKKPRR